MLVFVLLLLIILFIISSHETYSTKIHNSIVLLCISSVISQTRLEMGLEMFYIEFIPKVGVLKKPSNRERKPLLERRSLLERRPLLERRHSGCRRCCSRISSAHSDSGLSFGHVLYQVQYMSLMCSTIVGLYTYHK